jgi:hypothetical protein
MADTKAKWGIQAPEMRQMSAEKAIVLALHHLELAESMFNCIEAKLTRDIDGDDPARDLAMEAMRKRFALQALAARYPGQGAFQTAAAAFLSSLSDSNVASIKEWYEMANNVPLVDIDENGTVTEIATGKVVCTIPEDSLDRAN